MKNGQGSRRGAARTERPALAPVPPEAARTPRPGVGVALRRHWGLALLPALVLVALAIAAGLAREPTYTASTTLSVGSAGGNTAAVDPGSLTTAAQSFASIYSRSIQGDDIVARAARELGVDESVVSLSISAVPIPETAVFTVEADASSPQDAVAIANAAGSAVVGYSETRGDSTRERESLLEEYEAAALAHQEALAEQEQADEQFNEMPSVESRAELGEATAEAEGAGVQEDALRSAYQASEQGGGAAAQADVVREAAGATSDRNSTLALLAFAALVAGLGIGVGLALLRANRHARRLLLR